MKYFGAVVAGLFVTALCYNLVVKKEIELPTTWTEDVVAHPILHGSVIASWDAYLPICAGTYNLCGYFDKRTCEEVIAPIFEHTMPFQEDLAAVLTDGKFGYINRLGDFVIPPRFEQAGRFLFGHAEVIINGNAAVVDRKGRVVLSGDFRRLAPISGNLFVAQRSKNSRDKENTYYTDGFPRNLDPTILEIFHSDRFGVVDQKGRWVTNEMSAESILRHYPSELFTYKVYLDPRWNKNMKSGKCRSKMIKYSKTRDLYNAPLGCPGGAELFQQDGKWGIKSENNSVIVEPKYHVLDCFRKGKAWAAIQSLGKWCPINQSGKLTVGRECRRNYNPVSQWIAHVRPVSAEKDVFEAHSNWLRQLYEYALDNTKPKPQLEYLGP